MIARLDDGDEVLPVDLEDLVHRGEGDRQPALDAGRAARQAGAGPARDDRDAQLGGDPHELGDVARSWSGRRRPAAGRRGGTASRRRGSPRGRGCRSGAAGRAGAPRSRRRPDRSSWQRGVWWVVTRRVYAAGPSPEWRRGTMAPMSPRTPLHPCGPPDRRHRRLRAGRRAGRRGRSRGRGRSERAARVGRAAGARARRRRRDRPGLGQPHEPLPRRDLRRVAADLVGDAEDRGRLDGDDPQHLGRADRPDRAQHDRGAARQHPAPARSRSTASPTGATRSDQTIVVPLGGILPVDATTRIRVRFRATPAQQPVRLELAVHARRTGSSTSTAGCRGSAAGSPSTGRTTATRSRRRRAARSVVRIATSRPLVLATSGDRTSVSADGLTQTFAATNVRDFTVTAATDYRTRSRVVRDSVVRVYYRPGAPGAAMLDAAADAFDILERRLGPYPHRTFRVAQSAGAYGMESPGLDLDPDRGGRLEPALPGRPRDRPPVVLRDRRQRPGEAAVRRRGRGRLRGPLRAGPEARQPLRDGDASIGRSTSTRRRATTRRSTSRAATCSTTARRRMGSTAFWAALRGYIAANRNRISTTQTLLEALDAATPIDLGKTLFAPRFPRIY